MPLIEKDPDQPWPRAARELEIVLLPGTHQAGELDGFPDMVIRGGSGVVISGQIVPRSVNQKSEPPCTLRIHDGAHRLAMVGGIELCYSDGRGLRITAAEEIVLEDLFSHHHGIEAIITGNCPRGIYRRLRCEDSRRCRNGYTDDKRHGLYISGDGSRSEVSYLQVSRVTGSGLQLNGAGMNAIIRELAASYLEFYECGSGGTPPLSMMALQASIIERYYVEVLGNTNNRWGVMFADGKGPTYACHENTLRDYTVPRGSDCPQEQGSSRNSFEPGAGWSPEGPPVPEPPDVQADLDLIEQCLATISEQAEIAEAARARVEAALGTGLTSAEQIAWSEALGARRES